MTHFTRTLLLAALFAISAAAEAQNTRQSVAQVTSAVALTTAVDYTITGADPFTTTGSIDIQNEHAVVIFPAKKPSVAKQYLANISLNGTPLTEATAWVGIWQNGAIVYPHAKTAFTPLTVYTQANLQGDSRDTFTPYEFYKGAALGAFQNNIRSFTLRRGYMLTLACNNDGTGYSRVFVAQDEDLTVSELQKELKGRVGFVRVFPWNNVTKKGNAGGDAGQIAKLNATWFYDWSNSGHSSEDAEFVTHHHHQGWPSWNDINGRKDINTLLGNNEPDNHADKKEQYINANGIDPKTGKDSIEVVFFYGTNGNNGTWLSNAYASGMRVGSPAMSGGARNGWLTKFMKYAKQYNCRIDFVAAHMYWHSSGSQYSSDITANYNSYGVPTWITEFNYGANWTGESWPTTDRTYTDNNANHEKSGLSDICNALEANAHCERYAIYNWVQDCRSVYLNGALTKAGQWYADLKSKSAYSNGDNYAMKWNHRDPIDLAAKFYDSDKHIVLTWTNPNGKQTDSTYVERQLEGEKAWTAIDTLPMPGGTAMTLNVGSIPGYAGLATFRIHNFDSDSRSRYSGEVVVSIPGAKGAGQFQYGTLNIVNPTDANRVDFNTAYDEKPAVLLGIISQSNKSTVTSPYFNGTAITKTRFTYTSLPWTAQPNATTTYTTPEELAFLALPFGNYHYGAVDIEVGQVTAKDTTRVTFAQPFPEGVTPVVVGTVDKATIGTRPTMHRIWNVTNEGFTCNFMYEDSEAKRPTTNQTLAYMAVTPGRACIDEAEDLHIAAGTAESKLYGVAKNLTFSLPVLDAQGQPQQGADGTALRDTVYAQNPCIFADLQTMNTPSPATLRRAALVNRTVRDADNVAQSYTYGMRAQRVVDKSVHSTTAYDNLASADQIGWILLHHGAGTDPTAITAPRVFRSENPLHVSVVNRVIYVEGHPAFDLYTARGTRAASNATQAPGVYVVRVGAKTAKVLVR